MQILTAGGKSHQSTARRLDHMLYITTEIVIGEEQLSALEITV